MRLTQLARAVAKASPNSKLQAFPGTTWESLRRNYSLIPLFVIMGLGMSFVAAFGIRVAIKNPDVNWSKSETLSNEYYRYKQYKFLNPSGIDFSKQGDNIPNYRD